MLEKIIKAKHLPTRMSRLCKYHEKLKVPGTKKKHKRRSEHFRETAVSEQCLRWINFIYLEAIEGDKQPQDVIGAFEDAEYSQISHHSLHSSILQVNNTGSSQEERLQDTSSQQARYCSGCKAMFPPW